jgi:hypothetical protein
MKTAMTTIISMAMVWVTAIAKKWIVLLVNGNPGLRALRHAEVALDLALALF